MLPWSTCGHTQDLVRITPAKQYRMQLHVTTNAPAHRRRANDARLSTETQSRRSVQPVCSANLSLRPPFPDRPVALKVGLQHPAAVFLFVALGWAALVISSVVGFL